MAEDKRIDIINNVKGKLIINIPEMQINIKLEKKGQKSKILKSKAEELYFYSTGFKNMVENKQIIIDDLDFLKQIGIEEQEATAPVVTKILTDEEKEKLLTQTVLGVFKKKVDELTEIEKQDLADYAIDNNIIGDLSKAKYLGDTTGKDIVKAIELKSQIESDE